MRGSAAALALLDDLGIELDDCHLFHSARADMLRRLGRPGEAAQAYARADDAYLHRLKQLRGQRDALGEHSAGRLATSRAVEWLRVLGESLTHADVPEEKADLVHAIYDRVVGGGSSDPLRATHARGLCPWHGSRTARKGCNGAPDRS